MASRALIIVGGPTASGKTEAAIALAKRFGTEVISADSRQFYRAMRIGTARPLEHELGGVRHHFIGHLEIAETWSAGRFALEAEPVLQRLLHRRGIAVLTGGSGLYIDAVAKGLDPLPTGDPLVREALRRRLAKQGLASLVAELERLDPITHARIDRDNPQRVMRALEVCLITGQPFSAQRHGPEDRRDLALVRIALDLPRAELYHRIDARVDRMVAQGLVAEARALLPYRRLNALQTVGYRELFRHFDGELRIDAAIALIKQHTRNYAKRQLTWLRRDARWHWLPAGDPEALIAHAQAALA
ncbi:MAG: tRNA (adenosine(37)-N6)-dimethylallyltransferase MiaA [Flavobacteriales bacterium]